MAANQALHDFERGFFCAVAVLLREGDTQQARSLFKQGGNPMHADDCDIEVFRQHGLLPQDQPARK